MKALTLTLPVLVCSLASTLYAAGAAAQRPGGALPDSVAAYLDSALVIMERHVIGGDTVDWESFGTRVHERASDAEIPLD